MAQLSLLNDTALRRTRRAVAHRLAASFIAALLLVHAAPARAAEQMYFPATDNVTNVLIQKINAEPVGGRIDMSCWYLTEHAISIALINRFNAGVQVRLIGDRGSIFEIDPITKGEFYWLANQGLPIRLRFNPTWFPEIDHMKMTLFVGQNLVTFGSANYTPFELAPTSATNYKDESVLFSDDSALVNAFKTRFDQVWNDTKAEPNSVVPQPPYFKNFHDACAAEPTGNCSDFATRYPHPAPMIINTNRLEPDYPMPPGLIWGQGPQFNNRLGKEINAEPALVQFVIYRLTVDNITQALLNKWQSGVPVQLLIEPSEYMNRKWPEFWLTHANLDKLWAAGIPMKQRAHDGLTHMKTLVTSNYATVASSNYASAWQRDDNYFIPKSSKLAIYQAVKNRVTAMWNSPTAFTPFQPQPPDAPTLSSPGNGAANVPTSATLIWNAGAFAVSYDVYLGTSSSNLAFAANVPAQLVDNPPSQYSWQGNLPGGTTIFWKIVARTNATVVNPSLVASSATRSFTTAGGPASDFDGDMKADVTVYRPSNGGWYILKSSSNFTSASSYTWGLSSDIPVPGDFDGDARADIAVFRPSNGVWYILKSSTNFTVAISYAWGLSGDIPVVGDFDGDARADIAVFRPSNGTWYILKSTTNFTAAVAYAWGLRGDIPVAGDFDGDGRSEMTVFRPSNGAWYILQSRTNFTSAVSYIWGLNGDTPVVADYDGDGRRDVAVFRPSNGVWYILKSSANFTAAMSYTWGLSTDIPVPGDFDGDRKTDVVVYRPSSGTWYILTSSTNFTACVYYVWGQPTDIPVPRRP